VGDRVDMVSLEGQAGARVAATGLGGQPLGPAGKTPGAMGPILYHSGRRQGASRPQSLLEHMFDIRDSVQNSLRAPAAGPAQPCA
jgi:hypothetical protein